MLHVRNLQEVHLLISFSSYWFWVEVKRLRDHSFGENLAALLLFFLSTEYPSLIVTWRPFNILHSFKTSLSPMNVSWVDEHKNEKLIYAMNIYAHSVKSYVNIKNHSIYEIFSHRINCASVESREMTSREKHFALKKLPFWWTDLTRKRFS